jgi:hypothetical protein
MLHEMYRASRTPTFRNVNDGRSFTIEAATVLRPAAVLHEREQGLRRGSRSMQVASIERFGDSDCKHARHALPGREVCTCTGCSSIRSGPPPCFGWAIVHFCALSCVVTQRNSVERYLRWLGEPTEPPALAPARGPPWFKSRVIRRRLGEPVQAELFDAH